LDADDQVCSRRAGWANGMASDAASRRLYGNKRLSHESKSLMSPSSRIMSFAEYARIRHAIPYVVDIARGGSRLVLFGVRHTTDPADPIFDQIEAAFLSVSPALALHEGTPPAVESDREIAIRRHGESGLVRHLAARATIETASMDIPLAEEAGLLLDAIAPGDALVFLVVRQLASYNRKTAPPDFDAYFGDFFGLIAPALGIQIDWPLTEREHLRLLGRPLAAPKVTAFETDPLGDDLPTQRIARVSNRLRDEYMLQRLVAALDQHARVFATVGVSHAVMIEPALAAIGESARC